jgi:hypothetical protein
MPDTKPEEGIRMVPVTDIQRGASNGLLEQLLDLAADQTIDVYVTVPPGKVAYSDSLGVDTSHRGSFRSGLTGADALSLTRDRINNVPVIARPIARDDIVFLRLSPADIEALAAKGHTDVHWFTGALAKHPDASQARRGYVAYPRGLLSNYCLRPIGTTENNWRYTKPMRLEPEGIHRFLFSDLYLSDTDLTYLQPAQADASEASSSSASFTELTRGVRLLCLAAREFYEYAPPRDAAPKHDAIAQWLVEHSPDSNLSGSKSPSKELFNKTVSKQLASFVNPYHNRNKGKDSGSELDREAILAARRKYPHEFISDPLLLVIHLDSWWQLRHRDGAVPPGAIKDLDEKMYSLGLDGQEERKALARLFYWPNTLPDRNWREVAQLRRQPSKP